MPGQNGRAAGKLPAFWFYPSDWLNDDKVLLMPWEVRGMYIHLLGLQWIGGNRLPVDRGAIEAMLGGLDPDTSGYPDADRCWAHLETCFPLSKDGFRRNPRLDREWKASHEAKKVLSDAGRRGAEKRWGGHKGANATAVRPQCPQPQPNPVLKDRSPDTPSPNGLYVSSEPARAAPKKPRPAPNPISQEFGRWWETAWAEYRDGADWAWSGKERAGVNAARQKAGDDLEEMKLRATRMLEHPDTWMAENASPSILNSRWNLLGTEVLRNRRDQETRDLLAGYNIVEDEDHDGTGRIGQGGETFPLAGSGVPERPLLQNGSCDLGEGAGGSK